MGEPVSIDATLRRSVAWAVTRARDVSLPLRVCFLASVLFAVAACRAREHPIAPPVRPPPRATQSTQPTRAPPEIAVPVVRGVRLPATVPSLRVEVSPEGVAVDASAWSPTRGSTAAEVTRWERVLPLVDGRFPPAMVRGGEHGFLLNPLDERLVALRSAYASSQGGADAGAPRVAAVAMDRGASSRVAYQVLYTLGFRSFSELHLLASTERGEGVFVLLLPSGPPAHEPPLGLGVRVNTDGYALAARGSFVQPGCAALGPSILTIPAEDAARVTGDAASLTRCALALRAALPEAAQDRHVNVSVGPEITYGALLRALAALREAEPGACERPEPSPACLFPEVTLGVLR